MTDDEIIISIYRNNVSNVTVPFLYVKYINGSKILINLDGG